MSSPQPSPAIRQPGPDHPITIEPSSQRVRVLLGGRVVADSRRTLSLRESTYPEVRYFPRSDVDMTLLERSSHSTHCPYKGDAAYFSIPAGGSRSLNAIWTYESPHPAVASIADHLAFYPDRVDSIEISE